MYLTVKAIFEMLQIKEDVHRLSILRTAQERLFNM
ncbi:hypothetical protein SAMN05216352_102303 [Alteribacillus bidgolensis]|uniref:Uncharacterized protein n=1 Tax=Alteribacillus bidgolensis TaxID=930129 RepID=A0A1G8EN45_9BACI|nr:hypothetical protein SAMN05216352_102303 [Alteribacillus bidgolensis]